MSEEKENTNAGSVKFETKRRIFNLYIYPQFQLKLILLMIFICMFTLLTMYFAQYSLLASMQEIALENSFQSDHPFYVIVAELPLLHYLQYQPA